MTAVICIPWRGGVPSREMVFRQTLPAFERTTLPICTGDSDPALPFNRSAARNRAAWKAMTSVVEEEVGYVDVLAFLDADTYLEADQLHGAVERASATGHAVYPYTQLLSMNPLTAEAHPRVNFVRRQDAATGATDAVDPLLISGNVVIPRALFDRVGGWDERFTGYGWEDGAMARMLRLLGVVELAEGTLVCIEHSRLPEEQPDFSVTQRPDVLAEYDAAVDEASALALAERIRAARAAH